MAGAIIAGPLQVEGNLNVWTSSVITSSGLISAAELRDYTFSGSKILVSDASKSVAESSVASSQVTYLTNVSADIQTQINQVKQYAISGAGAGTPNSIVKFLTSTTMGDSKIRDDGSTIYFDSPTSGTTSTSLTANARTFQLATQATTTYPTTLPPYSITQTMGANDQWRIYGEGGSNAGAMFIETGDDGTESINLAFRQSSTRNTAYTFNPTTLSAPAVTATFNSVSASTLTIGNISNTEISYLDGVTSGIQAQLNGKSSIGHTHQFIVGDRVSPNSSATQSSWFGDGLYMSRVYGQDYPASYGNILSLDGTGRNQIFLSWAGTDAGSERMWFRNKRDNFNGWSPWQRAIDTVTDSSSIANWNSAYTAVANVISGSGTSNRVVLTDASQKLTTSTITNIELGHLSGVSSNIQTQLNGKPAISDTVRAVSYDTNVNLDYPENNTIYSFVGAKNATSGSPFGNAYYNTIDVRHRNGSADGLAGYGGQLVWGMTNYKSRIAFRTRNASSWESWTEIWTNSNLPITATHLTGTTSNIQTQLNGKVGTNAWNNQTIDIASAPASYFSDVATGDLAVRFGTTTNKVALGVYDGVGNNKAAITYTKDSVSVGYALNITPAGIKFPDNAFGGGGDTAGMRLVTRSGEDQSLELYVTNDITDWVNLIGPDNNFAKVNGNTIWNAGNFTPGNYLPLTGGIMTGNIVFSDSDEGVEFRRGAKVGNIGSYLTLRMEEDNNNPRLLSNNGTASWAVLTTRNVTTTTNYIPKFVGTGGLNEIQMQNSLISDDGTTVTISGAFVLPNNPFGTIYSSTYPTYKIHQAAGGAGDGWSLYGEGLVDYGTCVLELGDNKGNEQFTVGFRGYIDNIRDDVYKFRYTELLAPSVTAYFKNLNVDNISTNTLAFPKTRFVDNNDYFGYPHLAGESWIYNVGGGSTIGGGIVLTSAGGKIGTTADIGSEFSTTIAPGISWNSQNVNINKLGMVRSVIQTPSTTTESQFGEVIIVPSGGWTIPTSFIGTRFFVMGEAPSFTTNLLTVPNGFSLKYRTSSGTAITKNGGETVDLIGYRSMLIVQTGEYEFRGLCCVI